MSAKPIEKLTELVTAVAINAVMMDASSSKDVAAFTEQIRSVEATARDAGFKTMNEIAKIFLGALGRVPAGDTAKMGEVINAGIGALQAKMADGPGPADAKFVSDTTAQFEALFGGEKPRGDDILAAQRSEIPDFISNTLSTADEIERSILDMKGSFTDKEAIDALFRAFHTIKGEAGLLGLINLSKFAHETESVLEKVRSGAILFDQEIADLVLWVNDTLRDILRSMKEDLDKGLAFDVAKSIERIKQSAERKMPEAPQAKAPPSAPSADSAPAHAKHTEAFAPKVPAPDLSEGIDIFTEFINESGDHLVSAEESLLALEASPEDLEEINKIFRAFHTIKGLASFLNLDDIRILTHDTETMMDYMRKGSLKLSQDIVDAILASIDGTRKLLELLKEQVSNKGIFTGTYHDVSAVVERVRSINAQVTGVPAAKKEKLGEILIEKGVIEEGDLEKALEIQESAKKTEKIGEILVEMGAATDGQIERGLADQKKAVVVEEAIKIAVPKLDNLIDMMGELVISWTQIAQHADITGSENTQLLRNVMHVEKIVRDLQFISMSMRLVPIRPVFQKTTRLIRDLSKKMKKEIEVKVYGEETEVDKNIIELLADPIMHMVRNAVDHGIESIEKRLAKNKPACGKVELRAYHKSGNIVIEIKDDGAGLNRERILAKARERGLIGPDENPADSRIYGMIFEPGFSTAEQVTDVSGRGVGMDVVKKNIEKLRGKVEIDTVVDKGTTFTVKLPLTLAVIDGLILRVGEERYIAPIASIIELIKPNAGDLATVADRGEMLKVRGELFHLIRLDRHFNVRAANQAYAECTACLVDSDYGKACVLVDEIIGQQQIVIKSLGESLKEVKGLAGGTILGDGRVGLILDMNGIVMLAKK